jgi:CBS domain-containing protein
MDRDPVHVPRTTSFLRAAELFVEHGTSDLVVTEDGRYAGVLSEGDVLRALMPDFEPMLAENSTVSLERAAELFLDSGRFHADQPIATAVIRQPITLAPGDTLLKAAAVMSSKFIRRLPVIEEGRAVGMLFRANVSLAVLSRVS